MTEEVTTTLKGAIEDFRKSFASTDAGAAAAEKNVGWERTAASDEKPKTDEKPESESA
jgi:hypothetical protein